MSERESSPSLPLELCSTPVFMPTRQFWFSDFQMSSDSQKTLGLKVVSMKGLESLSRSHSEVCV
ncbi:hypothetical protein D3C87_1817560 [compost metagenome]